MGLWAIATLKFKGGPVNPKQALKPFGQDSNWIRNSIGVALMWGLERIVKIRDPSFWYYLIMEKFSTEKIMMNLDWDLLENLEEAFSEHPKGILLQNFVKLMKVHIPHKEHEKYDLVHGLCKLFKEIDINGDEHMEW